MQATNGSNSTVTINGYTLNLDAPSPGPAVPVPAPAPPPAASLPPAASPPASPNGTEAATNTTGGNSGRRLLVSTTLGGLKNLETPLSTWQQQWLLGKGKGRLWSHGQHLLASCRLLQHKLSQAWQEMSPELHISVVAKSLAQIRRAAAGLRLMTDQVLSSSRQIRVVMQKNMVKAIHTPSWNARGREWRMLASDADSGVDIEVTVNVPTGQNGSETSIEGPDFAPALQQSLSNEGTPHWHDSLVVKSIVQQLW